MTDIYIITECFQDYKGADTTPWGAYKTKSRAQEALREAIKERFDYKLDDMTEEEAKAWIDSGVRDWYYWYYDDGDIATKFYIDQITLED